MQVLKMNEKLRFILESSVMSYICCMIIELHYLDILIYIF